MSNQNKWIGTLGLAFLIGMADAASDKEAVLQDYVRHGIIAMGPTALALKVTLTKESKEPKETKEKKDPEDGKDEDGPEA